jgi:hypothetical protein
VRRVRSLTDIIANIEKYAILLTLHTSLGESGSYDFAIPLVVIWHIDCQLFYSSAAKEGTE